MAQSLAHRLSPLTGGVLIGGGLAVAALGDAVLPVVLAAFAFLHRAGVALRGGAPRRAVGNLLATGGWLTLWLVPSGIGRWLAVGLLLAGGVLILSSRLDLEAAGDLFDAQ